MDNISNNHPFIVVDSETYDFKESNQKPIPEGSALFTLTQIEKLLKKYLYDPDAQEEYELDPEALKDRIQQIKTGYGQKFEKLFWGTQAAFKAVGLIYSLPNYLFSFARINFRLETEQDSIDKMLVQINSLLQPPTALSSELVIDAQKEILAYLGFTSLCQLALVSRNAYKLAASSMLVYARECGFEGESPLRAKDFMKRLLTQVSAMKIYWAARATFFKTESYSLDRAEEILHGLKSFTTDEMLTLFMLSHLYNLNSKNSPDFHKFLCCIGKGWEKTLSVGGDGRLYTGRLALENAIDNNEPGFVNLLLQHGIEPTDEHLTLSLREGKDPEVVRLFLGYQASINKEESYILKGMASSSKGIRYVIYNFNLNYQFSDNHYLIHYLIYHSRYEHSIDWGADLEYVLKTAAEKGLSLGTPISNEEVNTSNLTLEFKPLSKNLPLIDIFSREIYHGHLSLRTDILETLLLLIKYGADREMALFYASAFGHTSAVEKILENFVRLSGIDYSLWLACGGYLQRPFPDFSKNLDIVKLLLKYGARADFYYWIEGTSCKLTALQLAQENGLTEIIEVLLAHQKTKDPRVTVPLLSEGHVSSTEIEEFIVEL